MRYLVCFIKRHKTRRRCTIRRTDAEENYWKLIYTAHIILQAANIKL